MKINHSILSRLQRLLEWPAHLAKHLRQRLRSSRALELDAKRDQPQPKRNQRQPALSLASVWPPGPRLILHLVLDQPRFFTVYIIAELATAALPCISLWVTTWVFRAWSSALDPHMGNVNPMVLVIVTKTLLRASVLLVRGVSLCAERELRHHLNGHIFVRNIKGAPLAVRGYSKHVTNRAMQPAPDWICPPRTKSLSLPCSVPQTT